MPPDAGIPKPLEILPLGLIGPEIVPRAEALSSTFRVRRVYTACRTAATHRGDLPGRAEVEVR
jgi:hypothetical protein